MIIVMTVTYCVEFLKSAVLKNFGKLTIERWFKMGAVFVLDVTRHRCFTLWIVFSS